MWTITKETGRRPCVQATTKEIPCPQRALCAFLGVWVPLTNHKRSKETKKKLSGDGYRPGLRLAPSSCASHTIHSFNLSAWAWSTPTPPSTYRPTPDNSRNLSNWLSHRGSERSTPIPFGFLPSHASMLAAANVALGQCSRAWDLVILALPSQNQHLSSLLFRTLLKYTTCTEPYYGRPRYLIRLKLVNSSREVSGCKYCVNNINMEVVTKDHSTVSAQ
jgi:hypothetical protein